MLDLLKIHTSNPKLMLLLKEHPLPLWFDKREHLGFDLETIKCKEKKIYEGIWFYFSEKHVEILFRPHYRYNNNIHNANDFSVEACFAAIAEFLTLFNLWDYVYDLRITNIEFGVNIVPPIKAKELVTRLGLHGKNEFRNDAGLAFSKKSSSEATNGGLNMYKAIKAYAKGVQFPEYCHPDTFRWEIKSKEAKYIRKLGINTISDLLHKEPYEKMGYHLLKEWNEVLILGFNYNFSRLTIEENIQLNKYLNFLTWYGIMQESRNQFSNHKRKYNKLLTKANCNIKAEIAIIIADKINELLIYH